MAHLTRVVRGRNTTKECTLYIIFRYTIYYLLNPCNAHRSLEKVKDTLEKRLCLSFALLTKALSSDACAQKHNLKSKQLANRASTGPFSLQCCKLPLLSIIEKQIFISKLTHHRVYTSGISSVLEYLHIRHKQRYITVIYQLLHYIDTACARRFCHCHRRRRASL